MWSWLKPRKPDPPSSHPSRPEHKLDFDNIYAEIINRLKLGEPVDSTDAPDSIFVQGAPWLRALPNLTELQAPLKPPATPPVTTKEQSMSIASQDIFDPMKAALGADAAPLLEQFVASLEAAADALLAKAGTLGMASEPAINALFGIGTLLGVTALQKKLGTAVTPAQVVTPPAS